MPTFYIVQNGIEQEVDISIYKDYKGYRKQVLRDQVWYQIGVNIRITSHEYLMQLNSFKNEEYLRELLNEL